MEFFLKNSDGTVSRIETTSAEDNKVKEMFNESIESLNGRGGAPSALHALSRALIALSPGSDRHILVLKNLAEDQNYGAFALHDLGKIYAEKADRLFVSSEVKEGFKRESYVCFTKASELGNQQAQYELALLCREGKASGNGVEIERYVALLEQAAKRQGRLRGDERAMCDLIAHRMVFDRGNPAGIEPIFVDYDHSRQNVVATNRHCPKSYYQGMSETFFDIIKNHKNSFSGAKSLSDIDAANEFYFNFCKQIANKTGSGLAFYEMSELCKVGYGRAVPKDDLLAFQYAAAAKMRDVKGIKNGFFGVPEYCDIDLGNYGDFGVNAADTPEKQQALMVRFTGVSKFLSDQFSSLPEEKQREIGAVHQEALGAMNREHEKLVKKMSPQVATQTAAVRPSTSVGKPPEGRDHDEFTSLLPGGGRGAGGNDHTPY